jgi:hypothetical protein
MCDYIYLCVRFNDNIYIYIYIYIYIGSGDDLNN